MPSTAYTPCFNPTDIETALQACEIKKLSEIVSTEPAPNMLMPCPTIQEYFHNVVPHIQKFLLARFDDVHQELQQMNTREMLRDATFYQVLGRV